MTPLTLTLEPVRAGNGRIRAAAKLIQPNGAAEELWWELPETWADALTPWADPWVVGFLFQMMRQEHPVRVVGRVSPSLLANLELFMRIWEVWTAGKYRPVAITAEEERELPAPTAPHLTLTSFSCGVDSCFTTYRHARGLAGRRTRRLGAGVLQHGFDVLLEQQNAQGIHRNMYSDATKMLGSLGLPCIPLVTNFRQLRADWSDAWGAQLASGLSLLAGRYGGALVANDVPYHWLGVTPWPIHPATTALFGSDSFALIDDGGECSRSQKAKVISQWPEAMRHLRVCFGLDIPGRHENCCRCEKCIRTILAFRAAGCPRPEAFPQDVSDRQIRRVRLTLQTRPLRWRQIVQTAEQAGLGGAKWVQAMRSTLRKQERRETRNRLQQPFVPLRNAIRRLARGTDL